MFRTLKDLFDSFTQPSTTQSPAARAHAVQLAAAVLLVMASPEYLVQK